jgi:tripartite-type tricarboxylate transporter receptor subunit TctC
MFKKTIVALLMCMASVSFAKETITLIWPFNIGSNQANTLRAMIAEANAIQTDYEILLDNKPGAGGVVAAKYVIDHPHNTVLAMSSSFFVRPNFTGGGPVYSIDSFTPVFVQATGSPIAVLSKRYSSYKDVPLTSDTTVGTAGVGTISDLVAANITNSRRIPYPSMIAADKDVAGLHIDLSTDFLGDITGLIDGNVVNVLGITGTRAIGKLKPLKGFEKLVANYGMYASTEMPESTVQALHDLFSKINHSASVTDSYGRDFLTPATMNIRQSQVWFKEQTQFWRTQADKVSK